MKPTCLFELKAFLCFLLNFATLQVTISGVREQWQGAKEIMVVQGITQALQPLISFNRPCVQVDLVPVHFPCATADSPLLELVLFHNHSLQVSSFSYPLFRRRVKPIYRHSLPLAGSSSLGRRFVG
ncbi:hypothetical protein BKA82DRAFT_2664783 [Pisolithus tinctorius]|nr:hypothetical protein BKA82DRAFT_2664783 [Pisolithus tinctorius]